MASFHMCPECADEYADPADRRFHAEPIACPACGPRLSIDLPDVLSALGSGRIVAVKGLGGFQLACDAFHREAVNTLRIRKRRSRKPFAVMMRDLETVARYCVLDETARDILSAASAPIVLLRLRNADDFPAGIASGLREIGVMLPYTPLHHLLLAGPLQCLVMTSGNLSEEPIVIDNEEAMRKLPLLADSILTHDRDIFMRVDDSVVRVFEDAPRVVRRARGYVPNAIRLAQEFRDVLATGGELKNTFCLTRGRYAILSQHIGDLENIETLEFFEETLHNLQGVYGGAPIAIAHDLHPDYMSTRWALARPEPKVAVQHHHAHIASCMAENGVGEKVIGVAFDGTGFGTDGQIWGGEFLVCDYKGFERMAHFRYVPLPGGDRAAREPFRMAAAYLYDGMGPECRNLDLPCWDAATAAQWGVLEKLIAKPTIRTSSCGRLFDAVSSICGISQESSYEGESAMLLEAAAHAESDGVYEVGLETASNPWILDMRPMVSQIAREIAEGRSPGAVSGRFHESLSQTIQLVCGRIRTLTDIRKVCLSGGTFQNMTLLKSTVTRLRRDGFEVFIHSQVPANDGGLSLGQAVVAAESIL
jgi:hydrogenase maturation protein HypF